MGFLKVLKKWIRQITCFFGFHKYRLKDGKQIPVTLTDPETGDKHNAMLFVMTCPYCGSIRYDIVLKDKRIKAEVM